MNPRGTNIYYISGHRRRKVAGQGTGLFGEGPYYPASLTADSVPNYDSLIPFNSYWNAQAYIDWYNLNVTAYGADTAKSKIESVISQWSSIGAEATYCTDASWLQFWVNQGITDALSTYCRLVNPTVNTASNILNAGQNASQALQSGTGLIAGLTPIILIGGGLWAANEFLVKPSARVSGAKKIAGLTGGQKASGLALLVGLYLFSKKNAASGGGSKGGAPPSAPSGAPNPPGTVPTILITAMDPNTHAVTFEMDVPGTPPFIDTVYPGDPAYSVATADGKYLFQADAASDPTGITLTINGPQAGGNVYASGFISYAFPQSSLPEYFRES